MEEGLEFWQPPSLAACLLVFLRSKRLELEKTAEIGPSQNPLR